MIRSAAFRFIAVLAISAQIFPLPAGIACAMKHALQTSEHCGMPATTNDASITGAPMQHASQETGCRLMTGCAIQTPATVGVGVALSTPTPVFSLPGTPPSQLMSVSAAPLSPPPQA